VSEVSPAQAIATPGHRLNDAIGIPLRVDPDAQQHQENSLP